MKENAIKFLADLPESKTEQFNKALELYRKSKNHNPQQVRYMNSLGFSGDRLQVLLYELKKLHNITDIQISEERAKKVVKMKAKQEENEFLEAGGLMINVKGFSEDDKKEVEAILEKFEEGASPEFLQMLKVDNEEDEDIQQARLSEFAAAITEYSGNAPEGEDRQSLINFILDEIVRSALTEPSEEEMEARIAAFSKLNLFGSEKKEGKEGKGKEGQNPENTEGLKDGPENTPEAVKVQKALQKNSRTSLRRTMWRPTITTRTKALRPMFPM